DPALLCQVEVRDLVGVYLKKSVGISFAPSFQRCYVTLHRVLQLVSPLFRSAELKELDSPCCAPRAGRAAVRFGPAFPSPGRLIPASQAGRPQATTLLPSSGRGLGDESLVVGSGRLSNM